MPYHSHSGSKQYVKASSLDFTASKIQGATRARMRVRIPNNYQGEPIISRLTSDYGLTVNITGALLIASSQREGLFDLELSGTAQQIQAALAYLQSLDVGIKGKANSDGDSW